MSARDINDLLDRLKAYLPDGEKIAGLRPLTAGHSNETYIVEGLDAILRLPPATAPLLEGHNIITQAKIYRELSELDGGPPVPRIVHICEDESVAGDPFFIMEWVKGKAVDDYVLPEWYTSLMPEQRGDMCRSWADTLGLIATLPPLEALGEPKTPVDELQFWQKIAAENECPELVSLIDELVAIPAPRSGPIGVVQGDSKISNLLFDNDKVSGVLDWELGYNGEPLSDLAYMLYAFPSEYHGCSRTIAPEGMWNREQIINGWEQASGRSTEGLLWYEAAEVAKLGGIYAKGKVLFDTGESEDQRMLAFIAKLDESIEMIRQMLPAIKKALL